MLRKRAGAEALATAQTNSHRSGFDSGRPAAGTARARARGGAGCGFGGVAHGAGVAQARRGLWHPALRWPTYIFVGLFFLLLAINPGSDKPLLSTAIFIYSAGFAAAIAPFIFLTIAMRRVNLSSAFPAAMVSAFAFVYVALPLGFLVQLREQWSGAFLLLYLLLVVWAGDIFAYFVGRSLGRHLMSPRISPKKTWEGALASLLASLVVGMLLYNYALPISTALLNAHLIERRDGFFALQKPPLGPALLLSAAINVAAQLGDLVESLIKRGAGVKDSGTILPGPWRHAGSHRRPALCRSGAMVLCGLARHAVVASEIDMSIGLGRSQPCCRKLGVLLE
jgi:CDP-diglyceride synthetase